ncbi:MAG: MBL fold metallo-hydrolase [Desulfovibrionales bacterium]
MNIRIVYIRHNCFVVHMGRQSLLFDPPDTDHLGIEGRTALKVAIQGRNMTVFVSHSHSDHCHHDLREILSPALNADFVLAYDVYEMTPENVPPGSLIMEPDQQAMQGALSIKTLESNDLGIAFLVEFAGARIYFGGDLADWCWENASAAAKTFAATFFDKALDRIAAFKPDVGFSNADPRLPCFGGASRFVQKVVPGVFVPMHAFGRPEALGPLLEVLSAKHPRQKVFRYAASGNSMKVNAKLDPKS